MKFSDLKLPFPDADIEWRIGSSGKNQKGVWATCLAYISARAIQDRLDDVCGPGNWKVSYRSVAHSQEMRGGIICELSIKIADEWICKEDGAEQTDYEAFKGGLSSAIKRAGAVWGIGRYLYRLDAAYAEISLDKKPGFRWAQLKDNTDFYWKPPKLPDWAVAVKSVNVGALIEPSEEKNEKWDPGETLVPFGKYKDIKIKELSLSTLDQDIKYWEDRAQKEGKPLGGKVSTYIEACKAYREIAMSQLEDLPDGIG